MFAEVVRLKCHRCRGLVVHMRKSRLRKSARGSKPTCQACKAKQASKKWMGFNWMSSRGKRKAE